MKISKTFHYDKFIPDVHNRDVRKITKLVKSMKKFGWIEAYPAHVVSRGDGKLLIKDGQHRCEAAKTLKQPIVYVVCENKDVSIAEINNAQTPWNLKDYLSSYCKQGQEDYLTVKEYHEKTGIKLGQVISMFGGDSAASGNQLGAFKEGAFKVIDEKHPEVVGDLILFLSEFTKWNTDSLLVSAISRCCRVAQFKPDVFKAKVQADPSCVKRQATMDDYTALIESIYNYRSKLPIPLKFLADQEMRKRTFCHKSPQGLSSQVKSGKRQAQ